MPSTHRPGPPDHHPTRPAGPNQDNDSGRAGTSASSTRTPASPAKINNALQNTTETETVDQGLKLRACLHDRCCAQYRPDISLERLPGKGSTLGRPEAPPENRLHGELGLVPPAEYEAAHYATQTGRHRSRNQLTEPPRNPGRNTSTGTPQGGILSPLLANIALSVLDEHFARAWAASGTSYQRFKARRGGAATYRLVRYADDFVVLLAGTQQHAEALREEVAALLAPLGLRLSPAKTKTCHIDEGFDFLGFHIQRRRKRGADRRVVYTYPSKKALASIVGRVRALTAERHTRRLPPCCASSTRCCRDGAPTSGTACRRRPSATWTSTPGTGWSGGSASGTTRRGGPSSSAATCPGGGRPRTR